jgi:hypothetical protein
MYHNLEFDTELIVDLEISPKHFLERLRIRKGMRLRAQLKPHVVETPDGPAEVADLFFEDGTTTRSIAYANFRFLEQ